MYRQVEIESETKIKTSYILNNHLLLCMAIGYVYIRAYRYRLYSKLTLARTTHFMTTRAKPDQTTRSTGETITLTRGNPRPQTYLPSHIQTPGLPRASVPQFFDMHKISSCTLILFSPQSYFEE